MANNSYNDFLKERRAKQFGFEPPVAATPEEVTDSVEVKPKKKKSTKKEDK